ncbi:hypothetical protein DTB58_22795 [Streptomyces griseus]|nr:hypothetical protein [Streptomyces griseus]
MYAVACVGGTPSVAGQGGRCRDPPRARPHPHAHRHPPVPSRVHLPPHRAPARKRAWSPGSTRCAPRTAARSWRPTPG